VIEGDHPENHQRQAQNFSVASRSGSFLQSKFALFFMCEHLVVGDEKSLYAAYGPYAEAKYHVLNFLLLYNNWPMK
jgi:hypothetical protein